MIEPNREGAGEGPQVLPLVSIVTPVYNGEAYVAEVIESVLEQDYPDVEHAVLDHGSTDGRVELMKRYGSVIRGFSYETMDDAAEQRP